MPGRPRRSTDRPTMPKYCFPALAIGNSREGDCPCNCAGDEWIFCRRLHIQVVMHVFELEIDHMRVSGSLGNGRNCSS
jgi:hypothetical protein